MRELVVAISGLSPLQPGRAVARALREAFGAAVRFVGLSYDTLEAGNYEPELFERSYLMPYPSAGADAVFARYELIKREGGLDVIFPTLDSELSTLLHLEARLGELGVKAMVPTRDMMHRRSKPQLPALVETIGARVPQTVVCPDAASVWAALPELPFPLFVKSAMFEAALVHSAHQLEAQMTRLVSRWGYPLLLQKPILGTELDVIALGDGRGAMIGCVPMKKLELDSNNKAWGGITVDAPDLIALAGDVIRELKWRGVLELEVMRDEKEDLYLIEINPRVPSWAYLAVAAGQNVIAASLSAALGDAVVPFERYRVGAMHLRQCQDIVASLGTYESLVMTGQARRA